MKKKGILITIVATIVLAISEWDLFGLKQIPLQITVPGFILGIIFTFAGPAIAVLDYNAEFRKKIEIRSLIISVCLILIGTLSIFLHLYGARIEIVLGVLIISFFYGTLAFKNKYEKWRSYTRSNRDAFFLSLFDFLGLAMLVLGIMFKTQRWPYADIMTIIGLTVFAIGVFAWNQKFKKEVIFRKETEDKLKVSLEEIEQQHKTLEEKQKEIIDSITYARRIQSSLLPTETYIENSLNRLSKKD
jgi:hypothetical protein